MALWRIATEGRGYQATDLNGRGAELTGGRWNSKGRAVVYCATSVSLACLETVVHLNSTSLPLRRFLVRIDVPEDVWESRTQRGVTDLPAGWDAVPEEAVSVEAGDLWLRKTDTALMAVPSAVIPEEFNVLVNPAHADASRLSAHNVRVWTYDSRIT